MDPFDKAPDEDTRPTLLLPKKKPRPPKPAVEDFEPEEVINGVRIFRSRACRRRWQFGLLLNAHGLMYGRAVEVGTDRGEFASRFLETWRGGEIMCVDHWKTYGDENLPWKDREGDFHSAIARLSKYGWRARLVREEAMRAAAMVTGKIVFVYIDASHTFKDVKEDCRVWWNRLTKPGIIGGHDWHMAPVRDAVISFLKSKKINRVYRVGCPMGSPSWYTYKDPTTKDIPWDVGGWVGRYSEH